MKLSKYGKITYSIDGGEVLTSPHIRVERFFRTLAAKHTQEVVFDEKPVTGQIKGYDRNNWSFEYWKYVDGNKIGLMTVSKLPNTRPN